MKNATYFFLFLLLSFSSFKILETNSKRPRKDKGRSLEFSQNQNCDNVLTTYTISVLNTETRSKLAWMNLVSQTNYEEKKQKASAIIPGYFSGDYASFEKKRSELYQEQNYYSDEYESR